MWAQRERSSVRRARLRAYVARAAGAGVLVLAIGCAERSPPDETKPPAAATAQSSLPALSPRPTIIGGGGATPALIRPRKPLPAPVAMPGGGTRIDMRGTGWHVRALERQADGTMKQVCSDAPDLQPAGAQR
jgi:hypothetical protein